MIILLIIVAIAAVLMAIHFAASYDLTQRGKKGICEIVALIWEVGQILDSGKFTLEEEDILRASTQGLLAAYTARVEDLSYQEIFLVRDRLLRIVSDARAKLEAS